MPDCWDGSLESKLNSIVDGLRANDSSFFGKELHATKASSLLVVFNGLEILGSIDNDLARNVICALSLESHNLANNHLSVFIDCLFFNALDEFHITFSASDEDLTFHKFD